MADPATAWPDMVAELVAFLRPELTPFAVAPAARRLGVTILHHEFPGPTRAATLDGHTVVLAVRLGGRAAARSFAHEVAHLMLGRGVFNVRRGHEELFADWLGRELCLPRSWLRGVVDAPATARRYEVPQATVAVQLAALGLAPSLQRMARTVLCATCGPLEHNLRCACSRWRRLPACERERLPDVRQHAAWRYAERSTCVHEALELPIPGRLGCER